MQSKANEIKELFELHNKGVLTKEEFEKKKDEILKNGIVDINKSNKVKDKSEGIIANVTNRYQKFKEDQAKKREEARKLEEKRRLEEEARVNKILSGEITPISTNFNLEKDEACYFLISAKRMAIVDQIQEYTENKTKKKGVIGRAIVGGILLGPLGALGGAATAGSKGKTTVHQKVIPTLEMIDTGLLALTSKRVLFIGSNMISLPYESIPLVEFPYSTKIIIKYPAMEKGEYFEINGPNAKDIEIYYKGIKRKFDD